MFYFFVWISVCTHSTDLAEGETYTNYNLVYSFKTYFPVYYFNYSSQNLGQVSIISSILQLRGRSLEEVEWITQSPVLEFSQ